jgi:hypothetical protein
VAEPIAGAEFAVPGGIPPRPTIDLNPAAGEIHHQGVQQRAVSVHAAPPSAAVQAMQPSFQRVAAVGEPDAVAFVDELISQAHEQNMPPLAVGHVLTSCGGNGLFAYVGLHYWLGSRLTDRDRDALKVPGERHKLLSRVCDMVRTNPCAQFRNGQRLTAKQRSDVVSLLLQSELHAPEALDVHLDAMRDRVIQKHWVGACFRLFSAGNDGMERHVARMVSLLLRATHPEQTLWLLEVLWLVVAGKGNDKSKEVIARASVTLLRNTKPNDPSAARVLERTLAATELALAGYGPEQERSAAAHTLLRCALDDVAATGERRVLFERVDHMLNAAHSLLPTHAYAVGRQAHGMTLGLAYTDREAAAALMRVQTRALSSQMRGSEDLPSIAGHVVDLVASLYKLALLDNRGAPGEQAFELVREVIELMSLLESPGLKEPESFHRPLCMNVTRLLTELVPRVLPGWTVTQAGADGTLQLRRDGTLASARALN